MEKLVPFESNIIGMSKNIKLHKVSNDQLFNYVFTSTYKKTTIFKRANIIDRLKINEINNCFSILKDFKENLTNNSKVRLSLRPRKTYIYVFQASFGFCIF